MSARFRQLPLLLCLALGGLTLAIFWPVSGNKFINYDDTAYVTENARVLSGLRAENVAWAFQTGYFGNWHPLTWISHMFDVEMFGIKPAGHHFTSLLLHVANAMLVFLLFQRMTREPWLSFIVAALFALHPVHVESVAWVSERKDVLSAFFALLSLWFYLVYLGKRNQLPGGEPVASPDPHSNSKAWLIYYFVSLVCFACALMSKAMVVTLPAVMLLLDYWPIRRIKFSPQQFSDSSPSGAQARTLPRLAWRDLKPVLFEKLPFIALAIVATVTGYLMLGHAGAIGDTPDTDLGDRLARALIGYGKYLSKAFWPVGLALPYPKAAGWSFGALSASAGVLLVLIGIALWFWKTKPYLIVGLCWFLGMLVPVIGIVQLGAHGIADRYTYLPLIGLFLSLTWLVKELGSATAGRRATGVALLKSSVGVVLLVACAGATRVQLGYWQDSGRLFTHTLAVTQGNFIAQNGLGLHLFEGGDATGAIQQFRKAVEINPSYDPALSNLGRALAQTGDFESAARYLEAALKLQPGDVKARNNLGNTLARLGRHDEAAAQFIEALRLDPSHASSRNNLALSLKKLGRTSEAITQYREAIQLAPNSLEAMINLSWLLATDPNDSNRNGSEAVSLASRACELTSYQQVLALTALSAGYAETGDFQNALAFAKRAEELVQKGALADRLAKMVEGFQAGHPFRETPEHL